MNLNLLDVIEQYGADASCREYLEQLRWPNGVRCPRCECESVSRIADRNQVDYNSCRYQFSVTAGTRFHDSHLPPRKWFLAIYLICESKTGISSKQLQRTLGTSYKTAWYMSHRIRNATGDDDQAMLNGIVEVNETWIGRKRKNVGRGFTGNKAVVVGAVERGGEVRLKVVANKNHKTLRALAISTPRPAR